MDRDLGQRFERVLDFVGGFFMGKSPVHFAAQAIAQHLDAAGIDYAIAGALALGVHGLVRATEDVDVLIRREDLERFKGEWIGRGYVNLRPGGKPVRDTQHGVKIDFLLVGDYPGDGKPKPVVFPDPATASIDAGRYRVLTLPKLVEMKLASGMSAPHRMQDLTDVMRLAATARLPRDLAQQLDPSVREKYDELWRVAQTADPE